jgi:hypothetical protein
MPNLVYSFRGLRKAPPVKNMKLNRITYLALPITAVAFALAPPARAATGFTFGATNNGSWAIQNWSTSSETITSFSISLTNDTFFDSAATAPGTSSTGWSTISSVGSVIATYPTDASTDGQTSATITTSTFNMTDLLKFGVDIDTFATPDSNGNPQGALVVAYFSNNTFLFAQLNQVDKEIGGDVYQYSGAAGAQAVPEPSSVLLSAVAAGGLLLRRRRR